jgi:hypothetical protein
MSATAVAVPSRRAKVTGVHDIALPLAINAISDVLAIVAAATWRLLRRQLAGRRRALGLIPAIAAGALWIISAGAGVKVAYRHELLGFGLLAVSGILCAIAATAPYLNLWRVGLVGADVQTRRGLTAADSLKLCTSDLRFLGTGATKLTRSGEFAGAMARCTSSGNTIRMLLSKPDAENLVTAAKLAAKPEGEYRTSVTTSLRAIAELRDKRGANIEVRFYSGVPPFRLMFINDRLCLFSYNVYGTADETKYPQLLIASNLSDKRRSYFWGLEKYFDRAWEAAVDNVWNFKEFL